MVATIVRLWHRDTRVVDVADVQILWNNGQVRLRHHLQVLGVRALDT